MTMSAKRILDAKLQNSPPTGPRVDHRQARTGLPRHIPGKDMFAGNRKAVQHPVIGIGGECGDGLSCFHLPPLSKYQSRPLSAKCTERPRPEGANYRARY